MIVIHLLQKNFVCRCHFTEQSCIKKCSDDVELETCHEEKRCRKKYEACNGKCTDPDLPIFFPWRGGLCTTEVECRGSKNAYMCNGMCIPHFSPCNNTCTEISAHIENQFSGGKKLLYLSCILAKL